VLAVVTPTFDHGWRGGSIPTGVWLRTAAKLGAERLHVMARVANDWESFVFAEVVVP
jgi:hypothetical protein